MIHRPQSNGIALPLPQKGRRKRRQYAGGKLPWHIAATSPAPLRSICTNIHEPSLYAGSIESQSTTSSIMVMSSFK
jgi:hypothetical protein